ncbi:MAG: type II secretion system F family protein [Syntrophaceae bacterium]
MPIFAYRSTTMEGVIAEGFVEAPDEKIAAEKIKNTGVILLEVRAPREKGLRLKLKLRKKKVDLTTFTSELSALLAAGLPLDRSLNILAEISEHQRMKNIVQSLLKTIREGGSFSDALQMHPEAFPLLYVNMVRAGEAGGVLDIILERLNEFLESSKELKDHVFSAMIYPTILFVTGGLSIILLLTFVLPRFSVIFTELGSSLPLSTSILLAVSESLKAYGWIYLIVIAAAFATFRSYIRSEQGRYRWDAIKLQLTGEIIIKLETARFCRTLGTLLTSGVPLLQALKNSREVVGNNVVAYALEKVSQGAKEGKGISLPLSQSIVFPQLALSMIKVGEETGQLDQMLIRVAVTYEKSLRQSIKRFMGFLEPVLILVMGLIIGFIVISVLLAIFSISELPF